MNSFIRALSGLIVMAAQAHAQPPAVRLTFGGGTATDLRGVRAGAYVIAPSATLFPHPNLRVAFSARGTRFVSRDWAIAGGAAVDTRLPVSRSLAVVLGVSGDVTRASYRATYLQGEAIPALELRLGPVTAWAGARGAGARTTFQDGPVPLPSAPAERVIERSSVGPAFGASISLLRFEPGEELRITYREEHGRPAGNDVVDRIGTATLAKGPIALSGTIGARRAPGEDRIYGGARIAIALSRGIAVVGGAETYPSNPLFNSAAGRSVSAGLSLSAGGAASSFSRPRDDGPRPSGAPAPAPGVTRLSIRAATALRVEVAGDWNQWRPILLLRAPNGVWYTDLVIPPGEYRYAFRIDGKAWEVPKGVAAVNDGFGGRSAWLSVRKLERTP